MTGFWLLTFGLIGYWVVIPLIDLIRTPKTTSTNHSTFGHRPIVN